MEKRKWYQTKAQWAAAKARELRAEAQRIRAQSIPAAQWRRVQGKMRAMDTIQREIDKFDRIARKDFEDSPTPF